MTYKHSEGPFVRERKEWSEHHGSSRTFAYSEFLSPDGVGVIVSTVAVLTALDEKDGIYRVIETRIFGGPLDSFSVREKTTLKRRELMDLSSDQHLAVCKKVASESSGY